MSEELLVGVAEIDITPPVGTQLAGSLKPRTSVGIGNPLYAKAIALESGRTRLAYVAHAGCLGGRGLRSLDIERNVHRCGRC